MAFQTKTDFCGLANGTSVVLASHTEGRGQTVTTCENDDGDTIDVTVGGQVMDPSNEYKLASDLTDFAIVLGSVETVSVGGTNKYFALKSVTINTSNSGEVGLSAQAEEVASATPKRTYTVTIASLKCRNKAQILNSLFTLGGDKVHLQSANYTISLESTPTTIDGARITTDVYGAKIECSLTAKQAGSATPVVTAGTGCTVTATPSANRPDSDYTSTSATVTKYLTADAT